MQYEFTKLPGHFVVHVTIRADSKARASEPVDVDQVHEACTDPIILIKQYGRHGIHGRGAP